MIRLWLLCAALLLVVGSKASADYVFDPKDLPENFACDTDWDVARCTEEMRFEAWYRTYDERYHIWLSSLLFDVNIYFAEKAKPLEENASGDLEDRLGFATPNLVDAVYSIALRRHAGWAFAIDRDARIRMVRLKGPGEIGNEYSERYRMWAPTSLAETAEPISAFWAFEEADLKHCKTAFAHLRKFPAQRGMSFWNERQLGWVSDTVRPSEDGDVIIVTADGDHTFVRARGAPDNGRPIRMIGAPLLVYDQSNGGEGYDWAKTMAELARPCLKPSTATPPWEKLLVAERAKTTGGD